MENNTGCHGHVCRNAAVLLAMLFFICSHGQACSESKERDAMELQSIKAGPPLFDGFLKIYPVTLKTRSGACAGEQSVYVLTRPGHNSAIIAPITFDEHGRPAFVLKEGDVRPAALLRGEPYVALGMVAGSLDHAGEDGMKIAAAELGEEIGARPLAGLVELGMPLPTMCVTDGKTGHIASTESDQHYMAPVSMLQDHPATGDGGAMEIAGIMKPRFLSISEAISAMDGGDVREGGRARVSLGRALDHMGHIPELDAYVYDLPLELQKRFTTCGLGDPRDPRVLLQHGESPVPPSGERTGPAGQKVLNSSAVSADLGTPRIVPVNAGAYLVDLTVQSFAGSQECREPVQKPFRCQVLHVDYDRVKVAVFFMDPGGSGPMVRLEPMQRPVLAAKISLFREGIIDRSEKLGLTRHDVPDLRVDLPPVKIEEGQVKGGERVRGESGHAAARAVASWCAREAPGAKVVELGKPVFASAGQSDLRYHFYAAQVEKPRDNGSFMPLAEALRRCRAEGDGDAHTEALLLRLASKLEWIPSLGMPVQEARRVMDTH